LSHSALSFSLQYLLDQMEQLRIFHSLGELGKHNVMSNVVKIALKIDVDDLGQPPDQPVHHSIQGLVSVWVWWGLVSDLRNLRKYVASPSTRRADPSLRKQRKSDTLPSNNASLTRFPDTLPTLPFASPRFPRFPSLPHASHARHERWWERSLAAISKYWSRITFRVSDADYYCTALYDRGGFLLFRWPFLISYGALLVGAIIAVSRLWPDVAEIAARMTARPLLSTAVMLATIVFVSMLHVVVHALACKAYGRKVREMGFFLLQGLLPTFYADVTDIFLSSRRVRVMVDFSGPMAEVVCGSIAFIGAYRAEAGFAQSLLFGVGLVLWESALLNLYPFNFLEMDGYNIVADLLAMPTLRQQALALVRRLPHRLRSGKIPDRAEWIQLGYLTLCFVSVLVYMIAHLDAVGVQLAAWRLGP